VAGEPEGRTIRRVGFRNGLVLGVLAALLCTCRKSEGPGGASCQFDPIDVSVRVPSGFAGDDCTLSIVHGDATVSYLFPSVVLRGQDAGAVITDPDSGPAGCSVEMGPAPTWCKRDATQPPDGGTDVEDVSLDFGGSAADSLLGALHASASDDIIVSLRLECTGAPTVNESESLCVIGL
jgi:hypothetical protein